jgi:hypothetical protein
MNAVISALKNMQIGCRFCHQLILNEAGAMAFRDGAFILVFIDGYLVLALHVFRKNKRKRSKLKRKVPAASMQWLISRDDQRQKEAYLGSKSSTYELSYCCREFYHCLKKEWGFSPKQTINELIKFSFSLKMFLLVWCIISELYHLKC